MRNALLTGVLFVALLPTASASAGSQPPQRSQAPQAKIVGLGEDTLTVQAESGKDTATAYFPVLNAGNVPASIRVTFEASTKEDVEVIAVAPRTVNPGATRVGVKLDHLVKLTEPVEGQIVVTGGAEPIARAVQIKPAPQPSRDWAEMLFWGSACVFGLVVVGFVIALAATRKLGRLGKRAPGAKWSFDSWATTLTAVGAILGTVLGDITLPEAPRRIDKDTLVQLNILFGILLVIGPFIFQAIPARGSSAADQDAGLTGYTWALLLSCALTGAAVLGELATLGLMGGEMTEHGLYRTLIWVGVGVLASLAVIYLLKSTWDVTTEDWEAAAEKAKELAELPQEVVIVQGGEPAPGQPREVTAGIATARVQPLYCKLL